MINSNAELLYLVIKKLSKKKQSLIIQMNSDLRMLQLIETASETVLNLLKINENDKFRISMAIREAVINAIHHGNKDDINKKVEIIYKYDDKKLEVIVKDQGNGFNYKSLPDPTIKDNLLKPSGRGIFFIRTFMDKVAFSHHQNKGLTVKMSKILKK
jgi:serine/threonine-protein kinase RsbW